MDIKKSSVKALKSILFAAPIITGVIILIGLFNALFPKRYLTMVFRHNIFTDPLIGAILGSVFAGNPINSYIIGGELLKQGISLVAVTAFLVSWITVGFVSLPAEMIFLGKKFAVLRNILAFIFSIIIAIVVVYLIRVL
ncbi:hypothetical protein DRP44_07560 [candidate division TA06 bacterium]|uniref:Permease n=1 Tax=candidate division TA06 bacterium TaxID=2250710 RepID=A0A660S591_UNCT6|nr:MAG: hypothetical protein DRP44_07560 [candidate division TA06 bacterium]